LKLLRPSIAAIDELTRNYRCSIILCTATQPALQAPEFDGGLEGVRELAPDPAGLFRKLQRVRVRHVGVLDDAAHAEEMRSREQVLCIVNNRRHARAVYERMANLPGARHLSTLMCARHRSEALAEIRAMLKRGDPCRLVATSLIEAGVDVSFPTVLRAEAGLDSIAQAAGRCNRNGEWPIERSEVLVFSNANDDWAPPPELRQFAGAARETLRTHGADPLSPLAIEAYFRRLYWQKGDQQLDAANLLGKLAASQVESLPLENLAAEFRIIDSVLISVIVPYGNDGEARALVDSLHHVDRAGGVARKLQRYLVQIPEKAFAAMRSVGAVQPVAPDRWGEQFMLLENTDLYDERFGLKSGDPAFVRAERLMW
jgi:CRISPR-associated endonuclease/helicase Cas3